jgi:hypothetical protein
MPWHSPLYKQYVRSNAWAIRKNQYYRRDNRQCAACGSRERVQLHHVSYDNLGHEPDQDLVPLCYKDHRNAHRAHQSGRFRDLRAATDEIMKIGGRQRARGRKLREFWTVATSPVLVIGRDGLVRARR